MYPGKDIVERLEVTGYIIRYSFEMDAIRVVGTGRILEEISIGQSL